MWQRWWSGANPSMVSSRGKGCSGRTHNRISLSGGRGSHSGGGRSICGISGGERRSCGLDGSGRRSAGTTYPGLESASSTCLHHTKSGEERGRRGGGFFFFFFFFQKLEMGSDMKREKGNWIYKGRGVGGGGRGK